MLRPACDLFGVSKVTHWNSLSSSCAPSHPPTPTNVFVWNLSVFLQIKQRINLKRYGQKPIHFKHSSHSQTETWNILKELWINVTLSSDCKRNLDNELNFRLLYCEQWNLFEINKKMALHDSKICVSLDEQSTQKQTNSNSIMGNSLYLFDSIFYLEFWLRNGNSAYRYLVSIACRKAAHCTSWSRVTGIHSKRMMITSL